MLQGIDVSSYQPESYGTSGLSFVFIKLTEGLDYVNPKWKAQRRVARDKGLVRGFYHYPHIANDPIAEADHFLRQVTLEQGDVLVLDWEWYGQSGVSNSRALIYRDRWLAYVKSKAPGHKVLLYSDASTWKNVDKTGTCGDGLWIADYTTAGQPRITFEWTFHQYADTPVDKDVANPAVFPGGLDDLKRWAGLLPPLPVEDRTPAPAQKDDDMPQQFHFPVPAGPDAQSYPAPSGVAWANLPNRNFHLSYDKLGKPDAVATVRVVFHDGKSWGAPTVVKVPAAGSRVDVPGLTPSTSKISVQCDVSGVGAAVEVW